MCTLILGGTVSIAMVVKLRAYINILGLGNSRMSVYFQQITRLIQDAMPSAKNGHNYSDLTPSKKL